MAFQTKTKQDTILDVSDDSILVGLTDEQKEAVTHFSGPCLVIAGAGTGKTKVITHRIAYLTQKKKIPPEQILALTFTEKAALEMMERVDLLLPLGTNTATITTFHSFAVEILRQYAHFIGLPADFSLLTNEEELIILKKHLFDLPLKILRPGNNPTKFLEELLRLFNRLRDEDISAPKLKQYAEKLITSQDPAEQESGNIYTEIAASLTVYDQILRAEGLLTFGHCITETIRLLKEHPSVLREINQRFSYLLVDEYQDTNWAQTELATVIAQEKANIMVVGDDDQAIYLFRGAASSNLLNFAERFKDVKKIVLTQNFRSTQEILDSAYRMIQHNNPDRLEFSAKINKRLYGQLHGAEPQLLQFQNLSAELAGITKQINDWLKHDIGPEDIAVLTRTRAQAAKIEQVLRGAGINVKGGISLPLYDEPIIIGLLAMLKLVLDPTNNLAFANVLGRPPFAITDLTRNKIMASRPYQEDSLFEHTSNLINRAPAWLDQTTVDQLKKLIQLEQTLLSYTNERPSVILLQLLHHSQLYQQLTSSKTEEASLSIIGRLFEEMQEYEERHRQATLTDFLELVEIKQAYETTSDQEDQLDPFAVTVSTVHQSKGLEFKAVIIAHCVKERFPSRNMKPKFAIPDSLLHSQIPQGDSHLEEERRLFYVAITRAKEKLVFTAAQKYGESKQYKLSPFIYESLPEKDFAQLPVEAVGAHTYLQAPLKLASPESSPVVKERITISHTDLSNYLQCPWRYRYHKILKIKVYPSAAINFGNSIHNTLRAYFDARNRKQYPTISELLDQHWISGGYHSRTEEKQRQEEGRVALQAMEEQLQQQQPLRLEWNFEFPIASGDRVRGRIDRIDLNPDQAVTITDYKTGQPRTEAEAKQDLQLGIYILAVEQNLRHNVREVTLDYVMANKKVTVNRADFQLEQVKSKLEQGINKLKNSLKEDNFVATPGPQTCNYCDYQTICPWRYKK